MEDAEKWNLFANQSFTFMWMCIVKHNQIEAKKKRLREALPQDGIVSIIYDQKSLHSSIQCCSPTWTGKFQTTRKLCLYFSISFWSLSSRAIQLESYATWQCPMPKAARATWVVGYFVGSKKRNQQCKCFFLSKWSFDLSYFCLLVVTFVGMVRSVVTCNSVLEHCRFYHPLGGEQTDEAWERMPAHSRTLH